MTTPAGAARSVPTIYDQFSDYRGAPTQADLRDLIATIGTRGVSSTTVANNGQQLTNNSGFVKCDATGGVYAMNLPSAITAAGLIMIFKKTDAVANAITLNGIGGQTIDGAATVVVAAVQFTVVRLYSDGANWFVI